MGLDGTDHALDLILRKSQFSKQDTGLLRGCQSVAADQIRIVAADVVEQGGRTHNQAVSPPDDRNSVRHGSDAVDVVCAVNDRRGLEYRGDTVP